MVLDVMLPEELLLRVKAVLGRVYHVEDEQKGIQIAALYHWRVRCEQIEKGGLHIDISFENIIDI